MVRLVINDLEKSLVLYIKRFSRLNQSVIPFMTETKADLLAIKNCSENYMHFSCNLKDTVWKLD